MALASYSDWRHLSFAEDSPAHFLTTWTSVTSPCTVYMLASCSMVGVCVPIPRVSASNPTFIQHGHSFITCHSPTYSTSDITLPAMSLPSSPPFENIRSPCPSGTASPVETQDSLSSSLMGSPLGLRNISSLPRLSTGTPKPSITPSLLDSPLSRKLQIPQHSRYYFEDDMAVFLVSGREI